MSLYLTSECVVYIDAQPPCPMRLAQGSTRQHQAAIRIVGSEPLACGHVTQYLQLVHILLYAVPSSLYIGHASRSLYRHTQSDSSVSSSGAL